MIEDASPNLVVFPRVDAAFRAHVDSAMERLDPDDPAELEEYLRDAYPEVSVRERLRLADFGGVPAWYVYRDGSLNTLTDEDWWTSPDLPEFHIDTQGTYVAANPAAVALVGRKAEEIIGMRIGSLTRHEPVDDPGLRAFAVLAETGVLESTAVVVRPDGAEVAVRYRLSGGAEDGYRMVMDTR